MAGFQPASPEQVGSEVTEAIRDAAAQVPDDALAAITELRDMVGRLESRIEEIAAAATTPPMAAGTAQAASEATGESVTEVAEAAEQAIETVTEAAVEAIEAATTPTAEAEETIEEPIAEAAQPITEPISEASEQLEHATEQVPRKVHALFRPMFGRRD